MGEQSLGAAPLALPPGHAQLGNCPSPCCYCLETITAAQLPVELTHATSVGYLCPPRVGVPSTVLTEKGLLTLGSYQGGRCSVTGAFQDRDLAARPELGCSEVCCPGEGQGFRESYLTLNQLSSCLAV